jgi:flagellar basal-body rod protein FlgG
MDRALFAAASGMAAQQQNLDAIADDLANADVAGFKGSVRTFAELVAPGEGGVGTVATGSHALFTQGRLARSGGPFDLAIDGPGFFTVLDERGRRAYTRAGEFSRAADGSMRDPDGRRLEGLRVPAEALSLSVAEDGTVSAAFASGTRAIGRIRLAEFAAPERLRSIGGATFAATPESGAPRGVVPGGENGPKLRFGMLERSNVSIVESMMRILTAQRAYEANAKGVQAADEMLRIANNLQRGEASMRV